MLQLIQIVGIPFLVCLMMSFILGYLGIHVLKREIIFVDIAMALNMTVAGVVAHKSALKDGELMKIPQYKF